MLLPGHFYSLVPLVWWWPGRGSAVPDLNLHLSSSVAPSPQLPHSSTGFLGSVGMPSTGPRLSIPSPGSGKTSSVGEPGAVARAALTRPVSAMQPDPYKPPEQLADPGTSSDPFLSLVGRPPTQLPPQKTKVPPEQTVMSYTPALGRIFPLPGPVSPPGLSTTSYTQSHPGLALGLPLPGLAASATHIPAPHPNSHRHRTSPCSYTSAVTPLLGHLHLDLAGVESHILTVHAPDLLTLIVNNVFMQRTNVFSAYVTAPLFLTEMRTWIRLRILLMKILSSQHRPLRNCLTVYCTLHLCHIMLTHIRQRTKRTISWFPIPRMQPKARLCVMLTTWIPTMVYSRTISLSIDFLEIEMPGPQFIMS